MADTHRTPRRAQGLACVRRGVLIVVRTLMMLAVGGSPLPGMFSTAAGLPWQAAVLLSILGLAAAFVLAWRSEMNRQERYRLWITLAEQKAEPGQDVDLNGALEDVLAPPRQVAGTGKTLSTRRRARVTRKVVQP